MAAAHGIIRRCLTCSLEDGTAVTAYIEIKMDNLVQNPSFEDSDTSMWKVTYEGADNPTDYQVNEADAHSGEVAFHFWSEDTEMDFSIEQEFTDLEPGKYALTAYFQGGDIQDSAKLELYASSGGTVSSDAFTAQGYANWQAPSLPSIEVTDGTLTIGMHIQCNAKGWGTIDDFTLNKLD